MLIYGGRSVSGEHRDKFNTTLIGNGRGFLLSNIKPTLTRGLFYCLKNGGENNANERT